MPDDESTSSNLELERSLLSAESGDPQILRDFLYSFLKGQIIVPDRNQLHIPLNVAIYPDDFLRVLAIQDRERTIVPVFSRYQYAEEWANHPLTINTYTGEKLVQILPDDWWICVNPAQEIEKDLSPWEIKKLSEGEKSFDEIIDELKSEDIPSLLTIEEVLGMQELIELLREEALKHSAVESLYLGKHQDLKAEQNQDELIIAIILDKNEFDLRQKIKFRFESIASPLLIGQGKLRILVEERKQSLVIGSFRDIKPIYSKNSLVHKKLLSRFYDRILGKR